MHSLYKMIKKEKYRKVINTKSYIMYMEVVKRACRCSQPPYLKSYDRCQPRTGTYSLALIAEKGHKNDRSSPLQPRFTQENASREVCAKEGGSLMKQAWSIGLKPLQRMRN